VQRATLARLSLALLAPLDWAVLCALLCAELAGRLRRRISPVVPPDFPPTHGDCTFVIATGHAIGALDRSLPALLDAIAKHPGNHEVLVVRSRLAAAQERPIDAPGVRRLDLAEDLDFGAATRRAIEQATRDIVVLVNNDTLVEREFLAPLLAPFRDPRVFGVASRIVGDAPGADAETGKTRTRMNGSDLVWTHEALDASDEARDALPVSWLHRGVVAIDRRKYRWLGGFDLRFDPFYFEDADLSHRAWKTGWTCVMAPRSRASRDRRVAARPRYDELIHTIVVRNACTFFWKDIGDMRLLARHCLSAARRRMRRARAPGFDARVEAAGFFAAVVRLRGILRARRLGARSAVRSDRDVFALACGDASPAPVGDRATLA
jgi:GT2 family glycosyltransferase